MLKLTVPAVECYDEKTAGFLSTKEQTLQLEHSLVSISKWESKWHKAFLSTQLTNEEALDYFKCMTITQNVDPLVYNTLPNQSINEINNYIGNPMTATLISDKKGKINREVVTSELMYYWMISLEIPFECEKWHLNRLLTLIKVCNIKNGPQKKMSKKDILSQNRSINAARRQQLKSNG